MTEAVENRKTEIQVAVGVVSDASGKLLVTRRPGGTHLAGYWEFPGGKIETGEDPEDALHRELKEETGILLTEVSFWKTLHHDYPSKRVSLHFFRCRLHPDSPLPLPIQVTEVHWAEIGELDSSQFPPANIPIIEALRQN